MEAFAAAGILGFGIIIIVWFVLQIVAMWKLFEKAGKPGWHSIIPILNVYDEYDMCWNGWFGILFLVITSITYTVSAQTSDGQTVVMTFIPGICAIAAIVLQVLESHKLAKAFGKGIGWTLALIFFDRIARLVLGLSDAQYIGKEQ